jgi:hypothetical protein
MKREVEDTTNQECVSNSIWKPVKSEFATTFQTVSNCFNDPHSAQLEKRVKADYTSNAHKIENQSIPDSLSPVPFGKPVKAETAPASTTVLKSYYDSFS